MQEWLSVMSIDIVSNYVAIVVCTWTALVIARRWRSDRDPLTASLAVAFVLQSAGLLASILSEVLLRLSGDHYAAGMWSLVFVVSFLLSFPPVAYFHAGLFHPRNKWYVPVVSFLSGSGVALATTAPDYYSPPASVHAIFLAVLLLVYPPIAVSCMRLAPLASKRLTRVKFWTVSVWAVAHSAAYVLLGIPEIFTIAGVVVVSLYAGSALALTASYLTAYLGWVMPSWFRARFNK